MCVRRSWLCIAMCLVCSSVAGQTTDDSRAPSDTGDNVAATVNGQPIFADQVKQVVQQTLREREATQATLDLLTAQALEQLIARQLILTYLKQQEVAASEADLDLAVARIKSRVTQQGLSWEEYERQKGVSEARIREALRWQLSWTSYLQQYLTDKNLQSFFERNRRDYDGSELRVAQVLFDSDPTDSTKSWEQATRIRQQIMAKQISFEQAVRDYSKGGSAAAGGELGWIRRHEPMHEAFSSAAFRLQVGEISPPVRSPFGIHLIHCLEIKPGKKQWKDVETELKRGATRFLFDWIADKQRPQADIQYTGLVPHFVSGSRTIRTPQPAKSTKQ